MWTESFRIVTMSTAHSNALAKHFTDFAVFVRWCLMCYMTDFTYTRSVWVETKGAFSRQVFWSPDVRKCNLSNRLNLVHFMSSAWWYHGPSGPNSEVLKPKNHFDPSSVGLYYLSPIGCWRISIVYLCMSWQTLRGWRCNFGDAPVGFESSLRWTMTHTRLFSLQYMYSFAIKLPSTEIPSSSTHHHWVRNYS